MIYRKAEVLHGSIYSLEDFVLLVFIFLPSLLAEEEIKLYWKALLRGFELAHHVGHIGVDERMGGKVAVGPTAEEGEVDFFFYLVFGEVVTGDEGLTDVGGDDADGVEIEIDTARYPATFTLLHRFPVLEGVVNEGLRSDGDDGVVEVAHLHRGEGYLLHRAVYACLLHRYPVALVQHVVAGETNTGNKS